MIQELVTIFFLKLLPLKGPLKDELWAILKKNICGHITQKKTPKFKSIFLKLNIVEYPSSTPLWEMLPSILLCAARSSSL